ncbi:NACHT domain-containing protein [Actinomadura monticuli]|uniref:NACHT domain-containing protein n=1 Tax=Actinomadura monticuli TaxID=3097367 RepID=A0ABV4Q788_9ACTN
MRILKYLARVVIAASLSVVAGVAVNQILNNGKLSWSWGYLALVFTVLGGSVEAAPQTAPPAPENAPPSRRKGSRRVYLRRMRSAVGQMETIGLVTQAEYVLRTRQVYVDVMLQPRTVSDVVSDTGIGPIPPAAVGQRAPLASFLTGGRVLAVLGAAGSGKTTLARYTALEMAERRRPGERRQLPVLLYLRDHAEQITGEDPPAGLAQIAVAAPWLDGVVSAEWLEKRLVRGRCVVLLDGLDEVADARDRSRLVQWVESQISRYPGNAYVVTSRPLGYDGNRLTRADVLQVQRFTSGQIRDFLDGWYRAIERRSREGDPNEIDRIAARAADDLFQRISGRTTLYDLAANPLLLTMIANVHRYRSSLPGSRAALYEEVCQVLLHRRQEAKNLPDGELDGLSGDKKERIVQELAWYMMRRKLRDIPFEEAERAIGTVMSRTAPDIAPRTFLDHVKRSGLLLEHQYRRYGFAHLTLQEYLAAALAPSHPSRLQLLVDNVSDPWWRETTLLWAARADAGPVVKACLTARTVTALDLAYTCAKEARELDPALRDRLDQLLNTAPGDPDEIRLLDGVAAARALQETQALDDNGTRICANPVPDDLWDRYVSFSGPGSGVPALGADLWARDIKGFLMWLNGLLGDGNSYRLPTPSEAVHALAGDLVPRSGTVLYVADGEWSSERDETRLVTADPDVHPHRPTADQIGAYPDLILDHTHFVFRMLDPFSSLSFGSLAAYVCDRDLTRPEDRLLHTVDLALDIAFSRAPDYALVRDRALESARELDLDLGRADLPGDERAFDDEFHDSLARAFGHALDEARDVDLGFDFHLVRDPDFALTDNETLAHTLGELLVRDARRRGLDEARLTAAPAADARNAARSITYDLNRTLDRAVDRALGLAHATDDSGTVIPIRDIPAFLDRLRRSDDTADSDRVRHLALARDLVLAQIRAVFHDRVLPRTVGLARDLAFARVAADSGLGSRGADTVVATGRACAYLANGSMAYAARRRRAENEESLKPFLLHRLVQIDTRAPADDPAAALHRAHRLAAIDAGWHVQSLVENATRLAAPLWNREREVQESDMVLAATSVLAALTLTDHGELTEQLSSALCTLIALTPDTKREPWPGTGMPRPQKLLVLVRN